MSHIASSLYSSHASALDVSAVQGRGLCTGPAFLPVQCFSSIHILHIAQSGDRKSQVDACFFESIREHKNQKTSSDAKKEKS
ncbi:MAG: hypothetical protein ACT6UH_09050 [Hydrogenophaga sp.]|uniref:hypothetical protein n=1 Tax=Hydrogenophaga sp. TaxID=1904254 RepID=UPI0040356D9F